MRLRLIAPAFAVTAALALTGCVTDGYGSGYGYSSLSVGYGRPYYGYGRSYYGYGSYYDPYWSYYSRRPYWGWYDNYYYPGTGIYIYDRWRRPVVWGSRYRSYWGGRRSHWDRHGHWNGRREWRDNWRDFDHDGDRRRWRRH